MVIAVTSTGLINNLYATDYINIQSDAAGQTIRNSLSACPQTADVFVSRTSNALNICANDTMVIRAQSEANVIAKISPSLLAANVSVSLGGTAYVCAAQAIYAVAQTGGTVYYSGILNYKSTSLERRIISMQLNLCVSENFFAAF